MKIATRVKGPGGSKGWEALWKGQRSPERLLDSPPFGSRYHIPVIEWRHPQLLGCRGTAQVSVLCCNRRPRIQTKERTSLSRLLLLTSAQDGAGYSRAYLAIPVELNSDTGKALSKTTLPPAQNRQMGVISARRSSKDVTSSKVTVCFFTPGNTRILPARVPFPLIEP